MQRKHLPTPSAATLLLLALVGLANVQALAAADRVLCVTVVQCLLGDDAVDFCPSVSLLFGLCACQRDFLPVKMFWNASSTLLASRAEVSINERLFSPALCQLCCQLPLHQVY